MNGVLVKVAESKTLLDFFDGCQDRPIQNSAELFRVDLHTIFRDNIPKILNRISIEFTLFRIHVKFSTP